MSLDGWKRASFLVGSESNVRQWEPLPGGSVRPSGPCCLGVAEARFRSPQRLLRMSHRQKHNMVAKRCQILRLTRHRRYAQGSAAGGGAL